MMKRILLILTLTSLIFACKKEDDEPTANTTSGVEGCMDTLALNYNVLATTQPDGACEYAVVEGCMDTIATNYNPEATVDDGSCEYPPSILQLSSITINAMPMTNNGATWDWDITGLTSDPDVFYVLKQGGGDIVSSSSQDNISTFPISFTENLPYTINNLSQEYTIDLYDNDQVAGIGENELIGSCSFTPNIPNGGNEYPTEINIQSDGVDMTLAIEWLP
jgi:hypothetical protein